jgi:hypothetical protein
MAALTKQQWFDKISAWVPKWYFEDENYQVAVFYALAKILNSADVEMRAQFDETFITRGVGLILDQHGYERSILRNSGESDANYSERIRQFAIALDPTNLAALATTFLVTGAATIYEHDLQIDGLDVDLFCDRECILTDIYYCVFTVKVPYQGVGAPGLAALEAVATAVNASKALGTLYRIVEFD